MQSVRFARTSSVGAASSRIHVSLFRRAAQRPNNDIAIEYKVADTQRERAGAFRLAHDVYVEQGLMRPNLFQMRVMPQHLLPTTVTFVALRGGRVIATLSLVGDGRLGLPMERSFGPEVDELRDPSCWLGEVSALASSSTGAPAALEVVLGLMRIMAQFSRRHGLDHLLAAVHPRQARIYRRRMGFQLLGEERSYPSVCNRTAVALHLDFSRLEEAPARSVARFFGEPIADDHLRFCPISATERRYFAPAVAYEVNLIDAAVPGSVLACA